ncbi:DUF551 domain-containing protein [Escherichia coli]
MSTITKEQLIEDLKASTQNSSGMFEISENTICELMSMLAANPSPLVPDEMTPKQASRSYCGEVRGYRDGWNACRAAMLHSAEPVSQAYKLNQLSGNSTVTQDSWISCSERMPAQDDWILIYSKHGEYMAGQVQGEYVELSDGTLSWLGNTLYWMPLPEPPEQDGE